MEKIDMALSAVSTEIAELREAVDRKRQLQVRQEMRTQTSGKSVQQYVVATCIEYRQELDRLTYENTRLKATNTALLAQNKALIYTVSAVDTKSLVKYHQSQIKSIAKSQQYHCACGHVFGCDRAALCVYCQKWACHCCMKYCTTDQRGGCIVQICKLCRGTGTVAGNSACPNHNPDILDETKRVLMR